MRLTNEDNKVVRMGPIIGLIVCVVLLVALVLYKEASDNRFIKVGEVAETDPRVTYMVIDLLMAKSIKVDYGCTTLCSVRVRKKDVTRAVQLLTADSKLNNYTFTEVEQDSDQESEWTSTIDRQRAAPTNFVPSSSS